MSKILIVEDEFPIALELEELLDSYGYEVVAIASTGQEAISMAQRNSPDLILMDIKLPGELDGIDTAIKIRLEMGIPSVFLTGYGKSEFVERAKAADSLGFILKPLNEPRILAGIELAIDKLRKEQAIQKSREQDALLIKKSTEALKNAEIRLLKKRTAINDLSQAIDVLTSIKEASKQSIENSEDKVACTPQGSYPGSLPTELLFLSSQELRVARMIQTGKNSGKIAESLNISRDTVNWHRKNIRKKLGLKSRKIGLMAKLASFGKI